MASIPFFLREAAQAGSQHEILGVDTGNSVGLREESLFLVRVPVLSEQRISTPASDSMADSFWTMAFLLGEVGGTDSHGGGDDGGETDGDTNDGDGQGELEDQDNGVGAVEARQPTTRLQVRMTEDQENSTNGR